MDLSWLTPNFLTQPLPGQFMQPPVIINPTGAYPTPVSPAAGPLPMGGRRPAVAPPVPQFTPPAMQPGGVPQVPGVSRQRPVAGGDVIDLGVNIPDLPMPPTLPMPARVGGAPLPNFNQVNEWLAQSKPTESGHIANILGGFAQGAAQQGQGAPTFSQMLAQIGAGGAQGFRNSNKDFTDYFQTRGQYSQRQAEKTSDVQQGNARIALENAKMQYDAMIKNSMLQYEYALKKHELAMPKVQLTANGLLVQQPGPDGKMTVQFKPTKTQLETMEQMTKVAQMMGIPGQIAESYVAQQVASMFQNDPVAGQGAMMQLAIQQTINRGAGSAVFGPVYAEAQKQATRMLQQENPTLASRPQDFQQELNRRIAAQIMLHPRIMEGQWVPRAAQQGIAAAYVLVPRPAGQQPGPAGQTPQQPQAPRGSARPQPGTVGEE